MIRRTAMKRKRPKPRKNLDPVFRTAYCDEDGVDELLFYAGARILFGGIVREKTGIVEYPLDHLPFHPHHIGHRGQKRDWRTNLIYIPAYAHDRIHHGHKGEPVFGTLLCLYAKFLKSKKRGDPEEFDVKLLDQCFGQNVAGWLNRDFDHPWLNEIRDEILEGLNA